jgi:hypothetical protein
MVENQNMMIYYISLPPHNLCVVAAVLYLRRAEKNIILFMDRGDGSGDADMFLVLNPK